MSLQTTHPDYITLAKKWTYIKHHYEVEVLNDSVISTYLVQKKQGESDDDYAERKTLADYTAHFSRVVESLVGITASVEDRTERHFGEILGDPNIEGTIMNRLWKNVDGKGTNWNTLMNDAAIMLIAYKTIYGFVDGIVEGYNDATIKILNPLSVTDWDNDKRGELVAAKVKIIEYERESIDQTATLQEIYYVYKFDGWEKYRVVKNTGELVGQGEYSFVSLSKSKILPIFRTELPLRRNVGYYLARKNNVIFNIESDKDTIIRNANYPKFKFVGNDIEFNTFVERAKKGYNVIQTNPEYTSSHGYMAPGSEPGNLAITNLEKKVSDFYFTAFQSYEDAVRPKEKTATQVRQERQQGISSILNLIVTAKDEFENAVLLRLEQIYAPDKPNLWGLARVQRTTDFAQVDEAERVKDVLNKLYGSDTLPATNSIYLDALTRFYKSQNFQFDDKELETTIEKAVEEKSQQNNLLGSFGVIK